MTTRSLSFGSLRALVSARRHDLAGNWSNIPDRDLSRTASDLLAVSYDDGAWADLPAPKRAHTASPAAASVAAPVSAPVDLEARRARAVRVTPPSPSAPHARAS